MRSIGPEGAKALASSLEVNKVLTECNLLQNNLDSESATMIANIATEKRIMLSGIKHDQAEANLYKQFLEAADAILIASDLRVSAVLKSIDLRYNDLGAEGWCAIFNALKENTANKIESWDLSYQKINDEIAKTLAEYISVSKVLTSLE